MLAIVHPLQHNTPVPDAPHRPTSSASSRSTRRPPRHSLLLSTTTTLSSLNATSSVRQSNVTPPPPRRHATVPHLAPVTTSFSRPPQPPLHHPPPVTRQPSAPIPKPLSTPPTPPTPPTSPPAFDIHSYPTPELLRLLASLLTQIAATNDKLATNTPVHEDPPSPINTRSNFSSLSELDPPIWRTLTSASRSALSTPSSTLTFHARNIPTISLESYLLRILRYCPTTNEVFLSLLVYFDRMSKTSNEATGKAFVIDSYNIHRLVIAGVTVASKFFSDVFYTNSRYAKVGGLPQAELNLLELQFLLLNDFRLVIPRDEMQRYAEQLILFSSSNSDTAVPAATPLCSVSSACPSQAMGAMDAYGGCISSDQRMRQLPNGNDHGVSNNRTPRRSGQFNCHGRSRSEATETETEGETEAETDGETDDEPTIRPTHSSASSTSEDGGSLYGYASACGAEEDDTGDEGGDEDEGDDEAPTRKTRNMDADVDGELTPERRPAKDEQMASP